MDDDDDFVDKICPIMSKVITEKTYTGGSMDENINCLYEVTCRKERCALWNGKYKKCMLRQSY